MPDESSVATDILSVPVERAADILVHVTVDNKLTVEQTGRLFYELSKDRHIALADPISRADRFPHADIYSWF